MARTVEDIAEAVKRSTSDKPISTKTHGILDYTLAPTLAFAPQAFGFKGSGPSSTIARVHGVTAMAYSSLTKYELGVYPVLPMKTHLVLDAVMSGFLAASPWLLGFGKARKKRTWLPHLMFAAVEMTLVAFTDRRSTPSLAVRMPRGMRRRAA
jgi:hypothetical protein